MNNLSQIMREKQVSGYKLAKLTGVSQSHISDIARGRKTPGIDVAKKVATALGVSLDDLVNNDAKAKNDPPNPAA